MATSAATRAIRAEGNKTMTGAFDLKGAQAELAELRQRGRILERRIAVALQEQLSAMGTLHYQAVDISRLLDETRHLNDESGK